MGAVLAGGGSTACCLGEAACCLGTETLICCGRSLQCSGAIGYPIMVGISTVLCVMFRFVMVDNLHTILQYIGATSVCATVHGADAINTCCGNQLVYRVGFALTLFFSAMLLLVGCFQKLHDGAWLWKGMITVAIFVASLWVEDGVMTTFASMCLGGASLFIVVQILILLEAVYAWNESWRAEA